MIAGAHCLPAQIDVYAVIRGFRLRGDTRRVRECARCAAGRQPGAYRQCLRVWVCAGDGGAHITEESYTVGFVKFLLLPVEQYLDQES